LQSKKCDPLRSEKEQEWMSIVHFLAVLRKAQLQSKEGTLTTLNIPIIFIPGTSGSSLDTSGPFRHEFLGDTHAFPDICETCPPVVHTDETFDYRPGPFDIFKPWAFDPAGPRVWIGPEAVGYLVADTPDANRGNHYFDVLQFDASGHNTLFPQIDKGTVLGQVNLSAGGLINNPIYNSLMNFLTTDPGGPHRPTNQGSNGLYLFPYDWRGDLPDLAAKLGVFVDSVLHRPEVQAAHIQKVALLTHSLGGLVARAYYLSSPAAANKVDQVISISGGFEGIILPLKILAMGDTWGFGLGFGPLTVGFTEWETEKLAQNWGTAYFQLPSTDDWFADDVNRGGSFHRSYIRDDRQAPIINHPGSVAWLQANHNMTLTNRAETFFTGLSVPMGNFQAGTNTVPHHRIISKGRMDTVVAVHIYMGQSDACQFAMQTGLPVNPAECVPVVRYDPIHGDGDSTVPYHGLVGVIAPNDDQVYILDNPNDHVEHFAITTRPEVHNLIAGLLDGTVTSQTQVAATFKSPANVTEIPY